jgi:hypothetical protein
MPWILRLVAISVSSSHAIDTVILLQKYIVGFESKGSLMQHCVAAAGDRGFDPLR